MNWNTFTTTLPSLLLGTLPGKDAHKRMMPLFRDDTALIPSSNAKESGVLVMLYPENDKVQIVLIQRTEGGSHSGQVALPGGKKEHFDANIVETALREANEEVSLQKESVEIVGLLSPLYINVSNFLVQPVVSILNQKPELQKSDYEVARILYTDLKLLFSTRKISNIRISSLGNNAFWKAPVYILPDETVVWGATAMILSELELLVDTIL